MCFIFSGSVLFPCTDAQNCFLVVKANNTRMQTCDINSTQNINPCSVNYTTTTLTTPLTTITVVTIPHALRLINGLINEVLFLVNTKTSKAMRLRFGIVGYKYYVAGCAPDKFYTVYILTNLRVIIDVHERDNPIGGIDISGGVSSVQNSNNNVKSFLTPPRTAFIAIFGLGSELNGIFITRRGVSTQHIRRIFVFIYNKDTDVINSISKSQLLQIDRNGTFKVVLPTQDSTHVSVFNCKFVEATVQIISNSSSQIQTFVFSNSTMSYHDVKVSGEMFLNSTNRICGGFQNDYERILIVNNKSHPYGLRRSFQKLPFVLQVILYITSMCHVMCHVMCHA